MALCVGIITYHKVHNLGALLQAYALQQSIASMGHDVQVIDYMPWQARFFSGYFPLRIWKYHRLFYEIVRTIFTKKNDSILRLTQCCLTKRALRQLPPFDVLVVGSDEIWNVHNPVNYKDTVYFGDVVPYGRRIAYAPSFGSVVSLHHMSDRAVQILRTLDRIAVRDHNSQRLVEEATGHRPMVVVDPTMLVGTLPTHKPRMDISGCLLIYMNVRLPLATIRRVVAYARQQQKPLVSLCYRQLWCDRHISTTDPFEFLGYFKAADVVITNTMHGTIFSVLYQCNFITLVCAQKQNKVHSLLSELGLDERESSTGEDIEEILAHSPDYTKVELPLDALRARSIQYLRSALTASSV